MKKTTAKKRARKLPAKKRPQRKPRKINAAPKTRTVQLPDTAPVQKKMPKPFEIKIPGLFFLKTDNWTTKEIIPVMLIAMGFILFIVWMLKVYVLPVLGALDMPAFLNKAAAVIKKVFKSRGP